MSHTAPDARADGLAAIAADLTVRVGDDPDGARDLLHQLDRGDLVEVTLLLAGMAGEHGTERTPS